MFAKIAVFIFYFFFTVSILLFALFFLLYTISLFISHLKGSPFVPTSSKKVREILNEIKKMIKGKKFLDLGCGDGRLVMYAAENGFDAMGVDINPILILWARVISRLKKIKAKFRVDDILSTDEINKADVIYIFLMPELISKLEERFRGLKKGTLIVSHGFKIDFLSSRLVKKMEDKPFSTFFYRI